MRIESAFTLSLFISIILIGCQAEKSEPPLEIPSGEAVMRVGDIGFYQLFCDNFERLPLQTKRYAYHLYRACASGRDIVFDQQAPEGLELRHLIDNLVRNRDRLDSSFVELLTPYAVKFWAFNGNYDPFTCRKFIPDFTFDEIRSQIDNFPPDVKLKTVTDLDYLKPFLFDHSFRPVLFSRTPSPGEDILTSSAVNLFDPQVTQADAEKYQSRYFLNSRLAYADGVIIEEVYRAGAPDVTPGRLAGSLERMIIELETAISYAPGTAVPSLVELVRYLRRGDHEYYNRHLELRNRDQEAQVDFIFGFLGVDGDPLRQRGIFLGMVLVEDPEAARIVSLTSDNAPMFAERLPIGDGYRIIPSEPPVVRCFEVLCAIGDAGSACPKIYSLPTIYQLRERFGSEKILLTNIIESHSDNELRTLFQEFLPTSIEIDEAMFALQQRTIVMTALHEFTEQGCFKSWGESGDNQNERLIEFDATLNEALALLVPLWFVGDSQMVDLGILPAGANRKGAYREFLVKSLAQLGKVKKGEQFVDDQSRATALISNYILEKEGSRLEEIDTKHYLRLIDVDKTHAAVGELIRIIHEIAMNHDYAAAEKLVQRYTSKFDPELSDEVLKRLTALNIPSRRVYIMPEPELVRNRMAGVKDVRIKYTGDFTGQMVRFDDIGGGK